MLHYLVRYILAMRIFGFKISRFIELGSVIVSEVGVASWPRRMYVIGKILIALLRAKIQSREVYRKRLLTCSKCPIYRPETRQCGSSDEVKLGCGCYMPMKAALASTPAEGCWLEQTHSIKKWNR